MLLKTLLSKNNITFFIEPLLYIVNIIIMVILAIFIYNNVYKIMTINENDIEDSAIETTKNINTAKFNNVLDKINFRKKPQTLIIGEIF